MSRTPLRFEKKYCLQGEEAAAISTLLSQHPAGFRSQHPPRWVQNLYFDDLNLSSWHWHESGVAKRVKWRARWYGSAQPALAGIRWEKKIRTGQQGYKAVSSYETADRSQLIPSLRNGYHRHYFQAHHGAVRLTVDTHLWFAQPGASPWQSDHAPIPYPITILELKYPETARNWVQQMTQAFPWRTQKSSKYVLGCQLLYA